ncbi:MAG: 2-phospho-L-lactate transferase [Acidimicrobiia bacterium]
MRIVLLSGGVGGARLARGLAAVPDLDVTVVVNVGDDDRIYGLHVSPDIDTVLYTLSRIEGPQGWGLSGDAFTVMEHLSDFPIDTSFRIGDGDLATNLYRTSLLTEGVRLSEVTASQAAVLQIPARVVPATDDPVRTKVLIGEGEWLSFQEYFVRRRHRDRVVDVRFEGAARAAPAPGVLEAIAKADAVVIGPSNPALSVWPILAVPGVAEAVTEAPRVAAVSPLIGGRALKGPAAEVLAGLGFPPGNAGVVSAYDGLLRELVVDVSDYADRGRLSGDALEVHVADTRIAEPAVAAAFARWLVDLL